MEKRIPLGVVLGWVGGNKSNNNDKIMCLADNTKNEGKPLERERETMDLIQFRVNKEREKQ